MLVDVYQNTPVLQDAIQLSLVLGVPLHPHYAFFWETLSSEELLALRNWLLASEMAVENNVVHKIVGVKEKEIKVILEKLCIQHDVILNTVKIVGDEAHIFSLCLGFNLLDCKIDSSENILDVIKKLTGITVKAKGVSYVGARMGRPEKAKHREMRPLVHTLFPVGLAGGSRRNLIDASKK